jgi:hypothetical protein
MEAKYKYSWIIEAHERGEGRVFLQINGDRATVTPDGAFLVFALHDSGEYLVGAIRDWDRVDIMSQITGHRNGFSKCVGDD